MKKTGIKNKILIAAISSAVVAAALCAVFVLPKAIPALGRSRAEALFSQGEYAEAVKLARENGASPEFIHDAEFAGLSAADAGDLVYFGGYYTDGADRMGPIEWRVLERTDDSLLVITERAVICSPVNAEYGAYTWENCALRGDLNGYYVNGMFDDAEREKILTTAVSPSENDIYSVSGGEPCLDRLFILSAQEVEKYFPDRADRAACPTGYAVRQGACVYDDGTTWWWLRTPGFTVSRMAAVCGLGCIHYGGLNVDHPVIGVRPAMRVKIG